MRVLDLFSAAAGGWSLGLHRAGFSTVAACESVDWRRALYSMNNPGVVLYDDVRTLTADRIVSDLGYFPEVVVGSPPCQDISSANTKGKGVEGERSSLFFDAIRIIGEGRPRWFALENSANLRTRGADAVLAALEALGYACWPFVVRAGDIGANHERPRSWLIGCDVAQVADPHGFGRYEGRRRGWSGLDIPVSKDTRDTSQDGCGQGLSGRRACPASGTEQSPRGDAFDPAGVGHEGRWARGYRPHGDSPASTPEGLHANSTEERSERIARCDERRKAKVRERADLPPRPEMGLRTADCGRFAEWRADWSLDDLADHLQLDDGLSAWVAQSRIAIGGQRGTAAASLIVEAFGDAVVPQIPEAIGLAILRTETAVSAIYWRAA